MSISQRLKLNKIWALENTEDSKDTRGAIETLNHWVLGTLKDLTRASLTRFKTKDPKHP